MNQKTFDSTPLQHIISFNKLLEYYDGLAKSTDSFLALKAKRVLEAQSPFPELREGFTDFSILKKRESVIAIILEDLFSDVLGNNEIKTASVPYENLIFNSSKRFKNILKDAGPSFEPKIRNQEENIDYIMAAVVILKFYYGIKLDFSRSYFYDIPDIEGVMHHYRILYNAEFLEIQATDKAKELYQEDIDLLLANFDNIDLWKEKIPPGSFIAKGFVLLNMFDITAEHTISEMKSAMISSETLKEGESFLANLQETFRSFFRLKSITVGFVSYDDKQNQFEAVYGVGIDSVILGNHNFVSSKDALCHDSQKKLLQENTFFTVTDVDKYYKLSGGISPYKNLKEAGYQSAIFAPISENGKLLAVLEIGSPNKNELNSLVAWKLENIMPFLVMSVLRSKAEEANYIDAIIQNECTSVHASVYWKFQEAAKNFILESLKSEERPSFNEIVFDNVSPLYGQIDIKDSSNARNIAIQRDLTIQLSEIIKVLSFAFEKEKLPIYEELEYRANKYLSEIKETLYTNSEQLIFNFVNEDIQPVFDHLKNNFGAVEKRILNYEALIDATTNSYYHHRKNYDNSVMMINAKLALCIDKRQEDAQQMFPHYFERYKTDGIEHNIYIGASLTQDRKFSAVYLKNIRLWQLQVMCEMENVHYRLKSELPIPLNVASLILVHNTTLSIRFRMDEKRFDVDGTYNARYEIIKKRIDKSYVKGTKERLTQSGKMVIVYSQKSDEQEYVRNIKFLVSKGYFTGKIEIVELEGLQGVAGLKAIRAEILYKKDKASERTYTYEDLMEELKK